MKRKPLRAIDIVNHKVHREASQGAAAMAGIPWCYLEAHRNQTIDKHPVTRLTKAPRRK